MSISKSLVALGALFCAPSALAWDVSVQLTADNAYAIYTGTSTEAIALHANESNALAQDIVNAESYNFNMATGDVVYVVAYSDDQTSQGLLAEFNIDGIILTTSNTDWEVMATGIDLDPGNAPPTLDQLTTQIGLANAGNVPSGGWVPSTIGELNDGSGPNFPTLQVSSMSTTVNWAWYESGNCTGTGQPFKPGCNHDEYLVFRMNIPLGGCCLPDDSCQNTTGPICEELGGLYEGDGVFCELDTTCLIDESVGACCIDGTCLEINEDKCKDEEGAWFGYGTTCNDPEVECEPVSETGACCIDGECADMTLDECWERNGSSYGEGTDCMDQEVVCHTIETDDAETTKSNRGCTSISLSPKGIGLSFLGVFGLLLLRRKRSL